MLSSTSASSCRSTARQPPACRPVVTTRLLAEQAEKWVSEAAVPEDVVARSRVRFAESLADGLIQEIARLEADAIVVGGSGGRLAGPYSLGSVVNELLHSSPVPVAVAPRGTRDSDVERVREVTCAIGERQGADLLLRTAVRFSKAAGTPLRAGVAGRSRPDVRIPTR